MYLARGTVIARLLVVAALVAAPLIVCAYDDGDFQIWNTNVQEFKINDLTKGALEEEFRWADDADEFYYHHYDAGFSRVMNDFFSLGGGYRHIFELKRGEFKAENEPYMTAILSGEIAGCAIEDRSRFEYRQFDYQDDSKRYRNKITVKLPWSFTRAKIQPFLSDEGFMSIADEALFAQNRLSAGCGAALNDRIKLEAYYMLQSSKGSSVWTDTHVFGTKIKIVF